MYQWMDWHPGDSVGPQSLIPGIFWAFYLLFIASLAGVLLDVVGQVESLVTRLVGRLVG